jgi:hypothetical protein
VGVSYPGSELVRGGRSERFPVGRKDGGDK